MYKFLTLLIAISFISTQDLSAQKVKDDRVSVRYTRLPSNPLDPSFTTYSSIVYGSDSGLERLGLNRDALAKKYFSVGGFKRVGQGGHFRVSTYVGYPGMSSSRTADYKETIGKGDEKKTVTRYKKVVTYTTPVRYKVEDFQGNIITSGSFGQPITFEWGEGATSSAALRKSWSASRDDIMSRRYKSDIVNHISTAGGNVKALYSYTPRKSTPNIEFVGKKDKGTEDFKQAYETTKAAFEKMQSDVKLDEVREEVRPAVEFWLSEKDKWSADDKKERRVRSACLYNLATVFYWLDELEESRKYANECVQLDYKPARAKSIIRDIESTKKLFGKNNTTSRHPYFDLSNATPPGQSAFGGLEKVEEASASGATLKGFVIDRNGDKTEGDFAVTAKEGEELKFGPKGNVSFNSTQDGRTVKGDLNPADVNEFTLNERQFMIMDFVPGAKGNTETKVSILELLYDGGAIKVFKYYPYDDALGDQAVEFAFQKKEETVPTSTNSTMFLLFNKGLQKYFAECADLVEVAGTGEFKKTEADIIRAARVFAEMCKID